ncbi:PxKF domain-containing protein [Nonomuraea sp. NPDC050556]|uniref:PxKF domain-containing protein n=1 Tax=Nonomuraea sp. NPDC050556 TaxID=3364369 RepID=UPI0037882B1D
MSRALAVLLTWTLCALLSLPSRSNAASASWPEIVSVSSTGHVAGQGFEPYGGGPGGHTFAISDDARYVGFRASSDDLGGQGRGVYLRDRQSGTTTFQGGVTANGDFNISADGRRLMLLSADPDLDPGVADGNQHCFVKDLTTGDVHLGSRDEAGHVLDARFCAMSGDGNVVAFTPMFTGSGIYLRDMTTNVTTRVAGGRYQLSLSGDGRYLAFGDSGVFVYDSMLGHIQTGPPGSTNNIDTISRDGRYVFIRSNQSLDPGTPCPGPVCSYRWDRVDGTVSFIWAGAGDWSSRDGNTFATGSNGSPRLTTIYDLSHGTQRLAGHTAQGTTGNGDHADSQGLNADGSLMGLSTNSPNFFTSPYTLQVPQLFLTTTTSQADTIAPSVSVLTPAADATFTVGQTVIADYTCTDEHGASGLASCVATADGANVGNGAALPTSSTGGHTFSVVARDTAGNTSTVTHHYVVLAGFTGPVDPPPTVNVSTAGSGVPLTFSLPGDAGLDILASGYPASRNVDCQTFLGQPADAIESTTSTRAGLTYNAGSDTYTYVWKTDRSWSSTCRQLILRFGKNVPSYANAQLAFHFRFR